MVSPPRRYGGISNGNGYSRPPSEQEQPNIAARSTEIQSKNGVSFLPNSAFDGLDRYYEGLSIDAAPISTQLIADSENIVQLVIGLDLGSSTTKVVIGSPDKKDSSQCPSLKKHHKPISFPHRYSDNQ